MMFCNACCLTTLDGSYFGHVQVQEIRHDAGHRYAILRITRASFAEEKKSIAKQTTHMQ